MCAADGEDLLDVGLNLRVELARVDVQDDYHLPVQKVHEDSYGLERARARRIHGANLKLVLVQEHIRPRLESTGPGGHELKGADWQPRCRNRGPARGILERKREKLDTETQQRVARAHSTLVQHALEIVSSHPRLLHEHAGQHSHDLAAVFIHAPARVQISHCGRNERALLGREQVCNGRKP